MIRLKSKRFFALGLVWLALGIWDFIHRHDWPSDGLNQYRWVGFLFAAVSFLLFAFSPAKNPSD